MKYPCLSDTVSNLCQEDEMAIRAAVLEQENIRLRLELEHLRAETERLRVLMVTPTIMPPPGQPQVVSSPGAIMHTRQAVLPPSPYLCSSSPSVQSALSVTVQPS